MDFNFSNSNRGEIRRSFPVYLISNISGFVVTHKWLLLTQLAVTVALIFCAALGLETVFGRLLFGKMDTVEQVFMNEFSDYLFEPMIGFIIITVAFLFYLYLIFLEPGILRLSIKDESRFYNVENRLEHKIGMHIVYIVMIIAALNITNNTVVSTGDDRDLAGYMNDYMLYHAGEISAELGVFYATDEPYNIDGYAKIQPDSGIVYLNYVGENEGSRKCLRCPEAIYKELDFTDSYTFYVTYMPHSLVVTDIVPVKITEEEKEKAAVTFGFDGLNAHEKEVFTLMYSEKLAEVWLTEQNDDFLFPVYFKDTMGWDDFEKLKQYYQSATYEYPLRTYYYDMYGGTDNNIFVTKQNTYFSVSGSDEHFTVDMEAYYERYMEELARIAEEMPEVSDDKEKVTYLAQYLIDCSDTLSGEEVLALEDGNLMYLCSTGYGPILLGYGDNTAYCQAYTGLLKAAGIEVLPVSSNNSEIGYCINLVKLDGEWYYADVYGADSVSTAGSIFYRDEDFDEIYGLEREVYAPVYGYTDLEVPATGTEQITADLTFTGNENQSPEKMVQYREALSGINSDIEGYLFAQEDGQLFAKEEEEVIRDWIEYIFLHVQTVDPETEEHLEFEYGKTANPLAEELFKYLAVTSAPVIYYGKNPQDSQKTDMIYEEKLDGFSDVIVGFRDSKVMIKGSDVRKIYETLTGLSADGLLDFVKYETPDETAIYEYNKEWDVLAKTGEMEFKDKSGNKHEGNIARSLYQYPAEVKVEKMTETEEGYEVIFYTNYTGYGEHYFTMQIAKQTDGNSKIVSLKKRY